MCQAQVRQIAPEELVIPNKNGFHLIVRSRFGAAAEALASEINLALRRRLFGSEPFPQAIAMSPAHGEVVQFARPSLRAKRPALPEASRKAEAAPGWADFKPAYIPVFHLQHRALPIHLCGPVSHRDGKDLFGADALRYCHPQYRSSVDLAMLRHSLNRLPEAASGKGVSAIATSVSYETMAWSRSRQLYLDALQAADLSNNAHFIVKLDDVPSGTPLCRMSDIVARLKPLVKRVFIQLPDRNTSLATGGCIGAAAYCATIDPKMGRPGVAAVASWLGQVATAQRGLSCILGVGDSGTLRQLRDAGHYLAAQHPDRGGICFADSSGDMASAPSQRAA